MNKPLHQRNLNSEWQTLKEAINKQGIERCDLTYHNLMKDKLYFCRSYMLLEEKHKPEKPLVKMNIVSGDDISLQTKCVNGLDEYGRIIINPILDYDNLMVSSKVVNLQMQDANECIVSISSTEYLLELTLFKDYLDNYRQLRKKIDDFQNNLEKYRNEN